MIANEETRVALDAALLRLGLDLSDEKKGKLIKHLELLVEKNQELNLTRITDFNEAIVLHIEDSLSVYPELGKHKGRFCDIGTGGGFPGLPLSIVSGYESVLLDSVKKKAAAVEEFVYELGLSEQVVVKGMRSEELAFEEAEAFDVVIARAVSSLSAVEELSTPLLKKNGHLIAMRGTESDEDIEAAYKAAEILGLSLIEEREFSIGDGSIHRSVYVFEKVGESKKKLPRRTGMAQKRPLGY